MDPINHHNRGALAWLLRNKLVIAITAVVGGVVVALISGSSGRPKHTKPPAMQMVAIALPPPPPPPPPPPRREPEPAPMQEEQMMIPQETVTEADAKPDEAPAPADASLGTGIKGDGPADGFGLGTSGSGNFFGGGTGRTAGGGGSRWGWYAGQVQSGIQTALSSHPRTRALALDTRVRVWLDANGRVERVEVPRSDAAPDVIEAVRAALLGVQLRQSAPEGMPMPIVLRISARRPA
jgi:periplasmic protein TonB